MAVGDAYARYRATRWWRADSRLGHSARLQMRYLLGESGPHDWDACGLAYVYETMRREEMYWRPQMLTTLPVEGVATLRALVGDGRGAIVNFVHHASYVGLLPSISRHLGELHVAVDPWYLTQTSTTKAGRLGQQHLHMLKQQGSRPFSAMKSYEHMLGLLAAGRAVALATDLPGNTEAEFLGRPVGVASGAARLAMETQAPIVPVTAHRHGRSQLCRIEAPIDPSGFDDFRDLVGEILRRHEPAVAAWPEAFERPLRHFRPISGADVAEFGLDPQSYWKQMLV